MGEVRQASKPLRGGDDRACPFGVCDGTGWILGPEDVARPCECRERRVARARSRGVASVIPPKYRGVGFDRPPITELDPAVVGVVREYVDGLEANLAAGRGLWLMGDVGTGKTSLAMLVSKLALEHGPLGGDLLAAAAAGPDPPHLRRRHAASRPTSSSSSA